MPAAKKQKDLAMRVAGQLIGGAEMGIGAAEARPRPG